MVERPMLNLEVWLCTYAVITVLITANGLAKAQIMTIALCCIALIAIGLAASDTLTRVSLVEVNRVIAQSAETIGIAFLLECLLAIYFNRRYRVPLLSLIAVLCYGLMIFYRWSYLPLTFFTQAIIYVAVFVVLLVGVSILLSYLSIPSSSLLLPAGLVTLMFFGRLPQAASEQLSIALPQLMFPLLFTLMLIAIGIVLAHFNSSLFRLSKK